jgi:peptidoglycan/LPS O-acetylase OafA/YrhL
MSNDNLSAQDNSVIKERTSSTWIKYNPALMGLRGPLAIGVVYSHTWTSMLYAFAPLASPYFVLSGFLITLGFLNEARKTNTIDLISFYIRRVLRIFPPLLFTVLISLVIGFVIDRTNYGERYIQSALGAIFFYSDYQSAFGHQALYSVFGHAWTLALEEQYYVIWAILVYILLRRHRKSVLLAVSGILCLASLLDRIIVWALTNNENWVYYSFDSRVDSVLLGCILAIIIETNIFLKLRDMHAKLLRTMFFFGTALYLIPMILLAASSLNVTDIQGLDNYIFFATSSIALAFIVGVIHLRPSDFLFGWLRTRVIVRLGEVSYAFYLWHYPIVFWINPARTNFPLIVVFILRIVVTYLAAELTYFVIETPSGLLRKKIISKRTLASN